MSPAIREPQQAYQAAVNAIQQGRWSQARSILETWAPRHPHPALWALLGAARHRGGDLEAACEAFATSLELAPGQPDTLHNLAITLRDLERPQEALNYCRRALALRPDYPAAQRLQAELHHALGETDEAEHLLRALVQKHPDDLAAWNNLGLLYSQRGEHAAAMEAFQHGLARKDDPELFNNLGLAALRAGHWERARQQLHHALKLAPTNPAIHNNLGLLAEREGDFATAEAHFRQALTHEPNHGEAHTNLARILLARGDLRNGWRHYRWRQIRRGRQFLTTLPANLNGKILHIQGEQGLGDELFFLRWIPQLRERGARIHYHTDHRLVPLLRRSELLEHVDDQPVDETQSYTVADLPWLLEDEGYPPPIRLCPDPQRCQNLHQRLTTHPRPWIGLTWEAGTPGNETLHKRLEPGCFGGLFRNQSGSLISLQHRPRAEDMATLTRATGHTVVDLNDCHQNLEDLLAVLALLDHYHAVSNTALHLRAGLGKDATIYVPHPPEWRWSLTGPSPWFPGITVFRQTASGEWPELPFTS